MGIIVSPYNPRNLCLGSEFNCLTVQELNDPDLQCSELISSFCKNVLTPFSLETPERVSANSADPDQMPQNAASDQGFHCLQLDWPYFSRNI